MPIGVDLEPGAGASRRNDSSSLFADWEEFHRLNNPLFTIGTRAERAGRGGRSDALVLIWASLDGPAVTLLYAVLAKDIESGD